MFDRIRRKAKRAIKRAVGDAVDDEVDRQVDRQTSKARSKMRSEIDRTVDDSMSKAYAGMKVQKKIKGEMISLIIEISCSLKFKPIRVGRFLCIDETWSSRIEFLIICSSTYRDSS